MKRLLTIERSGWEKRVSDRGFTFHSRCAPYWNEQACYAFESREIDKLEQAANNVHELFLKATQYIIDNNLFSRLGISPEVAEVIKQSWDSDQLHLYGRFDFAYDGYGEPKLLEYNADTPTSLLEASVIQWDWLQDTRSQKDQFNSIHESLIERWKQIGAPRQVHFATIQENEEDYLTTEYLRDAALQAGLETKALDMEEIGYDCEKNMFCGKEDENIECLFKLYPWEWMMHEDFGKYVGKASTRFIEPPWKMLWSNKGILPILWELYPNHPNLLPAYTTPDKLGNRWVRKPLLSREGQNVQIHDGGTVYETHGEYGEEGYIYQEYYKIPEFDGKRPVLGLWMIGDECHGMGIRESDTLVTDNLSRFTPHYIE